MATYTVTIPDAIVPDLLDAFADRYQWDGTGTKANFAKSCVTNQIRDTYVLYMAKKAAVAADGTARTTAQQAASTMSTA